MNTKQRAIKYAAMIFGILLAAGIVAGAISLILRGINNASVDELAKVNYEKSFDAEEICSIEVTNYDGTMRMETGTEFRVVGIGVPESFGAEVSGETLRIYYTKETKWFSGLMQGKLINDFSKAEIIVTVPEEFVAKKLVIDNGSGKMKLCKLAVEELSVNNGSGGLSIEQLSASEANFRLGSGACSVNDFVAEELRVNGGSGKISMTGMELAGVRAKTGSGALELKGEVNGDLTVETGSGSVTLELDNKREEYNISVKEGSGGVWLDGEKCGDYEEENVSAMYSMSLKTGSGRVAIELED